MPHRGTLYQMRAFIAVFEESSSSRAAATYILRQPPCQRRDASENRMKVPRIDGETGHTVLLSRLHERLAREGARRDPGVDGGNSNPFLAPTALR
jgi:hypothetical protein